LLRECTSVRNWIDSMGWRVVNRMVVVRIARTIRTVRTVRAVRWKWMALKLGAAVRCKEQLQAIMRYRALYLVLGRPG
jgi:hypothetical protein